MIQSACTTLRFSLCLRGALGVYIAFPRRSGNALPRRSGNALTACRQNGNEVPVICTFCFQEISLLSALASVCANDHAENFCLPPTMARPKAFFAPCSICVFTELCGQHKQQFISAAPAYIKVINQLVVR